VEAELERTDDAFRDIRASTDDYLVDVIRHLNRNWPTAARCSWRTRAR